MTDLKQAAQAVLDRWDSPEWGAAPPDLPGDLMEALRAQLEQPCVGKDPKCPCQDGDACHYKDCGDTKAWQVKPVAWMDREGDLYSMPVIENWAPPHTLLYTSPPQRKPLTDERLVEMFGSGLNGKTCAAIARMVEAEHDIKETP